MSQWEDTSDCNVEKVGRQDVTTTIRNNSKTTPQMQQRIGPIILAVSSALLPVTCYPYFSVSTFPNKTAGQVLLLFSKAFINIVLPKFLLFHPYILLYFSNWRLYLLHTS
jgi:hypothetical protein